MNPPRILIFGERLDHLFEITQLLAGNCTVGIFPLLPPLNERDLHPSPQVVMILKENAIDQVFGCLKGIRKKLPGIPVLFLAENPKREEIIEAFRGGKEDYLLFPLRPDTFLQIIQSHLEKGQHCRFGSPFRNWGSIIRRWLGRNTPEKNAFRLPLSKSNLGFALNRHPIGSTEGKKAIKQYYKCAEILRRELNIEPSQSTRELFRLIRAEKNIPVVLF